jgi:hypothetical protein
VEIRNGLRRFFNFEGFVTTPLDCLRQQKFAMCKELWRFRSHDLPPRCADVVLRSALTVGECITQSSTTATTIKAA